MKASYNWLKSYIDFDLAPDDLEYWLTALGLEVEGMEKYESIPGGLKGVVTGKVLTKTPHPNADRLSLTTVDIGAQKPLPIVCGAPNVQEGQKVLVATVGTELHPQEGEPFTIKKSKIRGEVSEGMICAEDELHLGSDHDGIMVLPEQTTIGIPASDLFPIETDTIYDIGLTPNRSDATAHLGVARDLAAGLGFKNGSKIDLRLPQVDRKTNDTSIEFTVRIEDSEACPRYTGLLIENISVGPSPDWIVHRLQSIGVRPINNVVDITNFVLHEYGQPLHAFDLDKIEGQGIIVKKLPQNTIFKSLDEVDRKLNDFDLMICDAAENPMCIGGVFGGANSGVTENTTRIFLESAHFEPEGLRKSSMRHNLRTDAAKVFEKGSDPNITDEAVWRAANLMKEYCGAEVVNPVFDIYPNPILKRKIEVHRQHVNRLIGIELSSKKLEEIFDHLNFEIEEKEGNKYTILIPTDKADVKREADVIEEVLRIYGYDNVDISSKLQTSLVHADDFTLHEYRNNIIGDLAAVGYSQAMNLSLSRSAYYSDDRSDLVHILNTSNSHLDIMRADMVHSALEAVAHNIKYQNRNVRLFEFGSQYTKSKNGYVEEEKLALICTGEVTVEHWKQKPLPADYFELKSALLRVFPNEIHAQLQFESIDALEFEYAQKITFRNKTLGLLGKISARLADTFDIGQDVYYGEIEVAANFDLKRSRSITYSNISKYPGVQRDIAIVVDENIAFGKIEEVIGSCKIKRLKSIILFDIYKNVEHVGDGKKSMAIRLDFLDEMKTLQDKDVDKMISKILGSLKHHLKAELR